MEASTIMFYILAACAIVCSILAVTSTKILRAATHLFFVLLATAGFYILLNYHFIAAVQISVYAGGVVVLYVFGIFLTNENEKSNKLASADRTKKVIGLSTAVVGLGLLGYVIKNTVFNVVASSGAAEIDMKVIGHALMGGEKYQYILPFEVLSVLLLACIIGGILIARKR